MALAFREYEIDPDCFELRRRGKPVKLEPKVFDVLVCLIEHRDRVVTKQELLDSLWPGEAVSDSVLPRCIAAARRALGDTRTKQRVIATSHGRGYRFVAALDEHDTAPATETSASVSAATGIAEDVAEPSSTDSDFVGRDDALKRLRTALDRTARGAGGVSFVVGEPGIGKTRIADEFAAHAGERSFETYVGRCYEGEGAPAYWPWLQVLRDAVARIEDSGELRRLLGTGAADLSELLPELLTRLDDLEITSGPEGEQARFRLFDAATRFLVELARRKPIVIVLDDLHWADASSLGLLRFLASQIRDVPLLVIATYRDVDVRRGHPLADTLGALARENHCDRVPLSGLDEAEVESFIGRLTGEAPSPGLALTVVNMTEGNPFFVREIVQLLVDQDLLEPGQPAQLDALQLPQGVRDAVGRRLDALSPECNEVLRAASVVGRSFRLGVVGAMVDMPGALGSDSLLELLAEALDAGIVTETALGRYAFAHALTQQALYEELRAPQRALLHRRAGEALEHAFEPARAIDENVTELAHHFYEAAPGGDVPKSIAYSVAAANACHRQHGYDEAVGFHERALEALSLESPVNEIRRAELLLALGEAKHIAGQRDAAHETLRQSAQIARAHEHWELMAEAAVAIRGFGELGSRPADDIDALLNDALERLPDSSPRLRSQLISRMIHGADNKVATRAKLAKQALALAEESGDAVALRDAWFARWWGTLGPDHLDERLEVVRALGELGQRTNDLRTQLLSIECAIGANIMRGDRVAVEQNLAQFEDLATQLRQPGFIFMGMNYRSSWLINQGRFLEAEARVEEAFEYGNGVVPFAETFCQGQLYWSRSVRGAEVDEMPKGSELQHLLRFTLIEDATRTILGTMLRYSADRDLDVAYEAVKSVDYKSIDRDEHWLIAMAGLTDVAVSAGDTEMTKWLYEALAPYADLIAIHDLIFLGRGSVGFSVALLAVGLQDLDAAAGHFERAIEVEESAGMRLALVLSRVGLAGTLGRRGAPGDTERAQALFDRACDESSHLGLGDSNPVVRLLERERPETVFYSDTWRRIQAS